MKTQDYVISTVACLLIKNGQISFKSLCLEFILVQHFNVKMYFDKNVELLNTLPRFCL